MGRKRSGGHAGAGVPACLLALTVVVGSTASARAGGVDPGAKAHTVSTDGFRYLPDTVRAHPGDTLVWTNHDLVPHTSTAAGKTWESGSLAPRTSWRHIVVAHGTYAYACDFHPTMTGVVVVR